MKEILLVLTVSVGFISGFFMMKKADDLMEEIRSSGSQQEQQKQNGTVDEHTGDVV